MIGPERNFIGSKDQKNQSATIVSRHALTWIALIFISGIHSIYSEELCNYEYLKEDWTGVYFIGSTGLKKDCNKTFSIQKN